MRDAPSPLAMGCTSGRAEALLKYDDAVRSGLFSKFWVATPTYYQERQMDPWIIGLR